MVRWSSVLVLGFRVEKFCPAVSGAWLFGSISLGRSGAHVSSQRVFLWEGVGSS